MKQTACALLLGLVLAAGAAEEKRAAVLFCPFQSRPENVGYRYLQELAEAGLTVDYLDGWAGFTWERISKYNTLVLFGFPFDRDGKTFWPAGAMGMPVNGGPNLDETLALVKRHLAHDGGILLNVQSIGGSPADYEAPHRFLKPLGAEIPMEAVRVPPENEAPQPRLRNMPFLYTENIAPSPVSEGIKGIWWPNPPYGQLHYNRYSSPIEVSADWQAVVRAPKGSRSYPFVPKALNETPEKLRITALQRPDGVAEPPLLAIRAGIAGNGRVGLFSCLPVFHVVSGDSWLHGGAMMNAGLAGKKSDFGRLLLNTYRWLAEPSLASGKLGGAAPNPERLIEPMLRETPQTLRDPGKKGPDVRKLAPDLPPSDVKIFRGLIGASSTLGSGTSTIADYARAAREKQLDFLVFLENYAALTPAKLAALTAECRKLSDDRLLLIPGYHLEANTGNRLFFYGLDPVLPNEKVISKRGKNLYMLQGEDDQGAFTMKRVPALDFQIKDFMGRTRVGVNNLGFFDFIRTATKGGMSMFHAKGFGAAALRFYENGSQVEDVTEQYLRTNAGCMSCIPVVVDLVNSAEELARALDAGHALTHVVAPTLAEVIDGLNKNNQFESPPVSVSSGPVIRHWPKMHRPFIYGEENFANGRGLMDADLHVTSDVGLAEIVLYQGERLFRRFRPQGAKEFHARLFLSALMQNNISAVATDLKGGKAVSFPLHSHKAGSQLTISYCGDHVNEGYATRMARGINNWPANRYPEICAAGHTWDGGPKAICPLVPFERIVPDATAADGTRQNVLYQYPAMILIDEGVYRGASVLSGITEFGGNPWRAWGPVKPSPMYDGYSILTEFGQYTAGVDPESWGGPGIRKGNSSFLYEQELTFKNATVLESLVLSTGPRHDAGSGLLLTGTGGTVQGETDLMATGKAKIWIVPTGGWFAVITQGVANPLLAFNRGPALEVRATAATFRVAVHLPAEGLPVTVGQKQHVELFTLSWPLDVQIPDANTLLKLIAYLEQPQGMQVRRGRRGAEPSPGLLDFQADNGVFEIEIPNVQNAAELPELSLAARIGGLQERWSAGLYQIEGYAGKQYYTDGRNVFRPLGVDPEGRCYTPLYPRQAANTHLVIGHPVVADARGKDLFIHVTALDGPYTKDGKTVAAWHVSVNNPTDQAITTQLKKAIDLPNFAFPETEITLRPGEYRILLHQL